MPKIKYKKRPDGRYEYKVTTEEYTASGNPRRKTVYGRTVAELERNIEDARGSIRQGGSGVIDNITVADWSRTWLETYKDGNVRTVTIARTYAPAAKYITDAIGNMRVRDVRQSHLQNILTSLNKQGKSMSLVRKVRICAVQMFAAAVANKTIIFSPAKDLVAVGEKPQSRDALSPIQQKIICDHYLSTPFGIVALTMMLCGLRRGEAVALTINDIDLKQGYIHITKAASFPDNMPIIGDPKTDAGVRDIPIPEILIEPLRAHLAASKGIIAFPKQSGGYHTVSSFRAAWKRFVAHCEQETNVSFDGITPHWLRHTYASLLYDAGVDLVSAKEWLGHESVTTTLKIYTHLSELRKKSSEVRVRELNPSTPSDFDDKSDDRFDDKSLSSAGTLWHNLAQSAF